jgi:hypothetical protein
MASDWERQRRESRTTDDVRPPWAERGRAVRDAGAALFEKGRFPLF